MSNNERKMDEKEKGRKRMREREGGGAYERKIDVKDEKDTVNNEHQRE